jgi:hypothetical protein
MELQQMKDPQDRVISDTRASFGISRATALELASPGCSLASADIDEDCINESSAQWRRYKEKATGMIPNISQFAALLLELRQD